MKKHSLLSTIIMTGMITLGMAATAFAGQWMQDDVGWWYQNEDGSYPAAEWKWIDSDGDGVAECYYFYSDGYMAHNNDIEKQYVNDDGQWVIDDKIQHKTMSAQTSTSAAQENISVNESVPPSKIITDKLVLKQRNQFGNNGPKYFYGNDQLWNVTATGEIIDRGDYYEVSNVKFSFYDSRNTDPDEDFPQTDEGFPRTTIYIRKNASVFEGVWSTNNRTAEEFFNETGCLTTSVYRADGYSFYSTEDIKIDADGFITRFSAMNFG